MLRFVWWLALSVLSVGMLSLVGSPWAAASDGASSAEARCAGSSMPVCGESGQDPKNATLVSYDGTDDDDDDDDVAQARPAHVLMPVIAPATRSVEPVPVERVESSSHHRLVDRPPIA